LAAWLRPARAWAGVGRSEPGAHALARQAATLVKSRRPAPSLWSGVRPVVGRPGARGAL